MSTPSFAWKIFWNVLAETFGLLTVNALTAADYLLIPTMAETFAAFRISATVVRL